MDLNHLMEYFKQGLTESTAPNYKFKYLELCMDAGSQPSISWLNMTLISQFCPPLDYNGPDYDLDGLTLDVVHAARFIV